MQRDMNRNTPLPNLAHTSPAEFSITNVSAPLKSGLHHTVNSCCSLLLGWCLRTMRGVLHTHTHTHTLTGSLIIYMSSLFINGHLVPCRSSVTRQDVFPLPSFCLLSSLASFRRLPLYKRPAAAFVPANVSLLSLQVPIGPSGLWAQI